ncbi:hypothetical protein DFA_11856 [Cavenderia fasciculata]|uniref:Uncharacterized protein n=1 Tax=Cavenderia fasciculata TaxID=261658 RepID=F4QEI1_CACFS|nr:uncharacterized protein DFA_11856 [Cavenderia fasciculata]EGG14092.1 hypothetical protein DFA_11856 [Cavenderia fasciculata]|eukprot:XP_004350800.1 hypothetical protein DFA_11856 [Cavenderia fasciculata]
MQSKIELLKLHNTVNHSNTKDFKDFQQECPLCAVQLDDKDLLKQHISYCSISYIIHIGANLDQLSRDVRQYHHHHHHHPLITKNVYPSVIFVKTKTILLPPKEKTGLKETIFIYLDNDEESNVIKFKEEVDIARQKIKTNTIKSLNLTICYNNESVLEIVKNETKKVYEDIKQSTSIVKYRIYGQIPHNLFVERPNAVYWLSDLPNNTKPLVILPSMVDHIEEYELRARLYGNGKEILQSCNALKGSLKLKTIKVGEFNARAINSEAICGLISSCPNIDKLIITSTGYDEISKQMVQCIADVLKKNKIKHLHLLISGDHPRYQPIWDALETNNSLVKLKLFFDEQEPHPILECAYNSLMKYLHPSNIKQLSFGIKLSEFPEKLQSLQSFGYANLLLVNGNDRYQVKNADK